jgi:hypothetical protein
MSAARRFLRSLFGPFALMVAWAEPWDVDDDEDEGED